MRKKKEILLGDTLNALDPFLVKGSTITPRKDSNDFQIPSLGTATTDNFVKVDASGNFSTGAGGGGGGTPSGSDRTIQFNNNGAFGGNDNLKLMADGETLEIAEGKLQSDVIKVTPPVTNLLLNPGFENWTTTNVGQYLFSPSPITFGGTDYTFGGGGGPGSEGCLFLNSLDLSQGPDISGASMGSGPQYTPTITGTEDIGVTLISINLPPEQGGLLYITLLFNNSLFADSAAVVTFFDSFAGAGATTVAYFSLSVFTNNGVGFDYTWANPDSLVVTTGFTDPATITYSLVPVTTLDDWTIGQYFNIGGQIAQESVIVHSGNYSIRVSNDNNNWEYAGQLVSGLTPATYYSPTFWGYTNDSTGVGLVLLDDTPNVATQLYNWNTQAWETYSGFPGPSERMIMFACSNAWTQSSGNSLPAPASGKIYSAFVNYSDSTTVFIDDVSLELSVITTPITLWDLKSEEVIANLDNTDKIISLHDKNGYNFLSMDWLGNLFNDHGLSIAGNSTITGSNNGDQMGDGTSITGTGRFGDPFVAHLTGPGSGDVVGPNGSSDSTIPLFDGTTGKLLKDSGVSLASLSNYWLVSSQYGLTPDYNNGHYNIDLQAAFSRGEGLGKNSGAIYLNNDYTNTDTSVNTSVYWSIQANGVDSATPYSKLDFDYLSNNVLSLRSNGAYLTGLLHSTYTSTDNYQSALSVAGTSANTAFNTAYLTNLLTADTADNGVYTGQLEALTGITGTNSVFSALISGNASDSNAVYNGFNFKTPYKNGGTSTMNALSFDSGWDYILNSPNFSVTGAGVVSCTGLINTGEVPGEIPTGVVDGDNMVFTLAHSPYGNLGKVFVGGLRVTPGTYTIVGTTLTLTSPPQVGMDVVIDYNF